MIKQLYVEYQYETVNQRVLQEDYIEKDGYKQLNIPFVLKRTKKQSKITGTYQFNKSNVLNIVELTNSKVLFSFDLDNGRNFGYLEGLATLKDNKAIFQMKQFDEFLCKFEMVFEKDKVVVKTLDNGVDCGFGNGIYVDKEYSLISRQIPKFKNN